VAREISVDRDVCMGSGQCLLYATKTFEIDDDGISVVIDQEADSEVDVQRAVNGCPTHAIKVTNA
jgi:ferredoxin